MRIETSRLLVTFFVLAAFLFGQAAALEHAAQYHGQVHTLADHVGGGDDDSGTKGNPKGHSDGLCDLSLFNAGLAVTLVEGVALCVPVSFTQTAFVPVAITLLGGIFTTGPPVRGPPHLS